MKRTIMRYRLLVCCSLLCPIVAVAQSAIGSWRAHLAYHNATQCAVVADKVYVLSDGSLYSYSPSDEFVECYDKTNVLSDQDIRHIAVDEESNTLVILYSNANIDLMRPDGEVVNITDFTNRSDLDPTVNALCVLYGRAYMATNFGVVVLNVEQGEFINTYKLNKVVRSSVEIEGVLYAATDEGLYYGDLRENLLDMSKWSLLNTEKYVCLANFNGQLMALKQRESVYRVNPVDGSSALFRRGSFYFMHCTDGRLFVGNPTCTLVYDAPSEALLLQMDGTINYLTSDGDTYWGCNGKKGLNAYRYDKEAKSVEKIVSEVIPHSPLRNYCQYMEFADDNRMLLAGGCLNYYDNSFFDGTLLMYEDGTWTSFQEEGIAEQTGVHYKNMTSIVQDPTDRNHHFASSFGQGIYEFRDMKFVRHITDANSELESAVPGSNRYTRIGRMKYDGQNNLWITNGHAKAPIKVMKPDGNMVSLYYEAMEGLPTMTEILFDTNGWIWVISMRYDPYLFCIDTNGTLENTADDRVRVFTKDFVDQDGQITPVDYIYDFAEDLNGDIWVMTDHGPFVLYNTSEVFSEDYHFTKIKIPRNDGTNYADYLLNDVVINCIEIDAANRKWIGTQYNGLYLIGADGLETVHHFTTENSPLPSNTIEELEMHHPSGELFIGTSLGLVSYAGDAMRGESEYSKEKVYAYPNPVEPDYDGLITIVGLKSNSLVKITNAAGRLVAEGTSLGGAFTWDGKTPQGQCVATGIYYVLGADEAGAEGIVTKILFVK